MYLHNAKVELVFYYYLVTEQPLCDISQISVNRATGLALEHVWRSNMNMDSNVCTTTVDTVSWNKELDFYKKFGNPSSFPIFISRDAVAKEYAKPLGTLQEENNDVIVRNGKRYKLVPLEDE